MRKTVYVAAKDQDDPLLKAIIKSQTDVSQELDEARAYARVTSAQDRQRRCS